MHDPAEFRSMHRTRFGAEPAIFVGPGRVNLIGEHTDYAEGFVMPAAINFATLAGISPRTDGKIVVYSENLGEEKTFDAAALPAKGSKHWTDYPMGVVSILTGEGHKIPAFSLSIWSDVPLASGLSSSAALGSGDGAGGVYRWLVRATRGRCWRGFARGRRTSLLARTAALWTSSSA